MIKIHFINNWGESTEDILIRYSKQTPKSKGVWDNLIGVADISDADYFIVLEGSNINTPIDKTIYIKREPDFIKPLTNNKYKHIIDFRETNGGVTYWLGKTYDELKSLEYPIKTKDASCVVSSKHTHRRNYISKLFYGNPNIDLYGRGHNTTTFGESYKGELDYNGNCKFNGLIDYSYSIVMENSTQKNYWTEKLADAYLSWCMPIYWGCPNLNKYFPDGSYRVLNIDSNNPTEEINNIINTEISNDDIVKIKESRDLILDEYNIWEVINKKIKVIQNGTNN